MTYLRFAAIYIFLIFGLTGCTHPKTSSIGTDERCVANESPNCIDPNKGCSTDQFGCSKLLYAHQGSPISIRMYPSPRYKTFLLGKGGSARVIRVIDTNDESTFIVKLYYNSEALKNDLAGFELFQKVESEINDIRVIKVRTRVDRKTLILEDVQGFTLKDAIENHRLSEGELLKALTDLYKFEDRVLNYVRKKYKSTDGQITFEGFGIPSYPPGVPTLRLSYGQFFNKNHILLKSDNIIFDINTKQLVIIDPH